MFFQFVVENVVNSEFLDVVLKSAKQIFFNDHPNISENPLVENYLFGFNHTSSLDILSLINHLIADLLWVRKTEIEITILYQPFVQFLRSFRSLVFTTLNHDRLLECLIENVMKLDYSDGFTKDQKILFSDEGKPLSVFVGDFSKSIQILKLHGSIDMFKYQFFNEENGSTVVRATDEHQYFKTLSFAEKQTPHRRNPETGKPVQTFHPLITPQFITGTKKTDLIKNDKMYSQLFMEFENSLKTSNTLLIIGYSYGDTHVNDKIETAITNYSINNVININPYMKFPFSSKTVKVNNIDGIDDLKKFQ